MQVSQKEYFPRAQLLYMRTKFVVLLTEGRDMISRLLISAAGAMDHD